MYCVSCTYYGHLTQKCFLLNMFLFIYHNSNNSSFSIFTIHSCHNNLYIGPPNLLSRTWHPQWSIPSHYRQMSTSTQFKNSIYSWPLLSSMNYCSCFITLTIDCTEQNTISTKRYLQQCFYAIIHLTVRLCKLLYMCVLLTMKDLLQAAFQIWILVIITMRSWKLTNIAIFTITK
jgi:hypothetical protein